MSRTYRKNYRFHWYNSIDDNPIFIPRLRGKKYCIRDKKPWYKPPRWFKQMKNQQFRARCKDAEVRGRDYPVNKKCYIWEWT